MGMTNLMEFNNLIRRKSRPETIGFYCSSCKYENDEDNCAVDIFEDSPCVGYEPKKVKKMVSVAKKKPSSINYKKYESLAHNNCEIMYSSVLLKKIQRSERCMICSSKKGIGFLACYNCFERNHEISKAKMSNLLKMNKYAKKYNLRLERIQENIGEVIEEVKPKTTTIKKPKKKGRVLDI